MARGPYNNLPSHQFWRSAVASMPSFAIDPIVSVPFTIAPADKVASAGSCFAQRVARQLQNSGYNYYVPEDTPPASATTRRSIATTESFLAAMAISTQPLSSGRPSSAPLVG